MGCDYYYCGGEMMLLWLRLLLRLLSLVLIEMRLLTDLNYVE